MYLPHRQRQPTGRRRRWAMISARRLTSEQAALVRRVLRRFRKRLRVPTALYAVESRPRKLAPVSATVIEKIAKYLERGDVRIHLRGSQYVVRYADDRR